MSTTMSDEGKPGAKRRRAMRLFIAAVAALTTLTAGGGFTVAHADTSPTAPTNCLGQLSVLDPSGFVTCILCASAAGWPVDQVPDVRNACVGYPDVLPPVPDPLHVVPVI